MHKVSLFSRNKIVFLFFATIFLCFLATTTVSISSLSKVIAANEQNAARLIAMTIHSHIRDFLVTNISAAKTMAEDYFLKESLREDAKKRDVEAEIPIQTRYLRGFVHTTNIDTAYIVSELTHRYFSHRGLHKVIDPLDVDNPAHEHDSWYPAFIKTGMDHNIQLDTNPVEDNEWTIFFNNRILDDDGKLLGVCGVGIKMARLQSLLHDLETQHDIEIYMTNEKETSQIGSKRLLLDKRYLTLTERSDPPKPITFLQREENGWQCRVGLEEFGWELIINKSDRGGAQPFSFLIANNVLLLLCLFGVMFFIIHRINRSEKKMLTKMAHIDVLTGLENRSAIDRVDRMLQKDSLPGALFVIDVDNFKRINDTLGHPAGDIVLRRIAGILKNSFRKGDVIARIGGDEFMVYSPGMVSLESIREKSQQMENAVQAIRRLREAPDDPCITISVSMGIALFPLHGKLYNQLYHCADTALYTAKESGKSRFAIFN
ncbi:MAG: GGDEF domain-containing protein [Desulfovibrio sp.]|nr:GGDEF domain-containing protein [Desulfovibrio sp.]